MSPNAAPSWAVEVEVRRHVGEEFTWRCYVGIHADRPGDAFAAAITKAKTDGFETRGVRPRRVPEGR